MDTTGVVLAVTLLVVVPLLGIAAAPWLAYPITKLVGVASYLYLLPLSLARPPDNRTRPNAIIRSQMHQ
jgi:hypothetical protein